MFLKTIGETEAAGRVAAIYDEEKKSAGLLMSATTCWTVRPDLLPLWHDFFEGVKAGFTLPTRDWLLITFIAALEVPSTYCTFVYAKRLAAVLGSTDAVLALRRDFREAGLSPRDVAMLAHAQKVARAAHEVGQADIDGLRAHGFSDPQIGDIALAASLRAFMSRFFEATGAGPEAPFIDPDPDIREVLTVGRRPPA
jgi:uncharacterized peroxidase-related enzyme